MDPLVAGGLAVAAALLSMGGTYLVVRRFAAPPAAPARDPARDAELWTSPLGGVGPAPPVGRGLVIRDGRSDVVQVALDA